MISIISTKYILVSHYYIATLKKNCLIIRKFNNISVWTVAGLSALSVTMGAHRLYTHRTYKCNEWVKFLLVFGQTVAGQVNHEDFLMIIVWFYFEHYFNLHKFLNVID